MSSTTTLVPVLPAKYVPLDKLEGQQISNSWKFDDLGHRVRLEVDRIDHEQSMLPVRAIFVGCMLAQIRATIEHGKWLPWIKEHFGKKKSTVYLYIALAEVCAEKKKLKLPELVALPQLSLDLEPGDNDDAASAMKKIRAFVGDQSLRDLLDLHEVQKRTPVTTRGGKREKSEDTEPKGPAAAPDWCSEAEKAIWGTLTSDEQRHAFTFYRPMLNELGHDMADQQRSMIAHLDDRTRADAIATAEQLLRLLSPGLLRRS